ncbi:hypothetical protein ACWD4Z_22900 [Streptomyces antibioticus]
MARTARVGDVVLVAVDPLLNNGAETAPAIVTRTWSGTTINVRVLYDQDTPPEWRCSLTHADVLPDADPDKPDQAWRYRWTWPTTIDA